MLTKYGNNTKHFGGNNSQETTDTDILFKKRTFVGHALM